MPFLSSSSGSRLADPKGEVLSYMRAVISLVSFSFTSSSSFALNFCSSNYLESMEQFYERIKIGVIVYRARLRL